MIFFSFFSATCKWHPWSEWSVCNAHCDQEGIQFRARNKIQEGHGRGKCNESSFETRNCTKPCECKFSNWSEWSPCSHSCGSGFSLRTRNVLTDNKACNDSLEESKPCYLGCCAVDGKWSPWGQWSDCSVSCNSGTRKRLRLCDSPKPDCKGLPCPGNNTEIENCNVQPCGNISYIFKFYFLILEIFFSILRHKELLINFFIY